MDDAGALFRVASGGLAGSGVVWQAKIGGGLGERDAPGGRRVRTLLHLPVLLLPSHCSVSMDLLRDGNSLRNHTLSLLGP